MSKVSIEKKHGLFTLKPVYEELAKAADGIYSIEVKKVRKPRTMDQNGWLWGCIYPMLMEALIYTGWEFTNIEQVHEFFKTLMTNDKVINKHSGEIIKFPESTSIMDSVTFSTYCEKLRDYGSEFLNIQIPDPDPNWKLYEKNAIPTI